MALKTEGYQCSVWEEWSRSDSRYRAGECERKWDGFEGEGITGATITQMAKDRGWEPSRKVRTFDWDDEIGVDKPKKVVNEDMIDMVAVPPPATNFGSDDLLRYIEALFNADDKINFVTNAFQHEEGGKFTPKDSGVTLPASELIRRLQKYRDDITYAIGDYTEEAGAWIRINPLDGVGVGNTNVSDFRYALIESDSLPIDKQWTLINELKLPIAAVVHSGGKSIHAIVKIEANNKEEYSSRVDFLHAVCAKNGLEPDKATRNPARLSRLPGVKRGENKQYLIATHIGLPSWDDWTEFIKLSDNDLPEPILINGDRLKEDIKLPEEIIYGVLRRGRNMILSSGSKAGKSFAMIELALAMATGRDWLGWKCKQGSVLYVDFELQYDYFMERLQRICDAAQVDRRTIENFYYMDMRGHAAPMEKLADKIISRAKKYENLSLVIIDPIYKILGGDESDMAATTNFGNIIDEIGKTLNCSVVYVHHHSKGGQAGKKAIDRASGSSVLGRQNDAIIDMCDIDMTDEIKDQLRNKVIAEALEKYFGDKVSDFERGNADQLIKKAESWAEKSEVQKLINRCDTIVESTTALRIEGSLRDFRSFTPFNIWFKYPIHVIDDEGILDEAVLYGEADPNVKGGETTKKLYKARAKGNDLRLWSCFQKCKADVDGGEVTTVELFEKVNDSLMSDGKKEISDDTLRNWLKKSTYLETVARGKERGKQLPAYVRLKLDMEKDLEEDFPDGFLEE